MKGKRQHNEPSESACPRRLNHESWTSTAPRCPRPAIDPRPLTRRPKPEGIFVIAETVPGVSTWASRPVTEERLTVCGSHGQGGIGRPCHGVANGGKDWGGFSGQLDAHGSSSEISDFCHDYQVSIQALSSRQARFQGWPWDAGT